MSSSSSSNPEVKETAFVTWDVTYSELKNSRLYSDDFNAQNSENKFGLALFANQQFNPNQVFTRLYYYNNQTELPLQYRVSILDANGRRQYTREYTWNYSESDYTYSNANITNFISLDKCKELVVDDNLKFNCEVDILNNKPQLPINLLVKETATLTWSIDAFRSLNAQVYSPMFSKPISTDQFALQLIPAKLTPFGINHVIISLHYKGNKDKLPLQYRVSIIDLNGNKQYTREYTWNYSKSEYAQNNENVTNYIHKDKCNEFLVNDSFKIYCEVDILVSKESESPAQAKIEKPDIVQKYESILESHKYSDFIFVVGGIEFKVHKAILAASSEVFDAMFSNDLDEKSKNRVEIPDIDVDVFEQILRYIYTGKVPEMKDYAADLFVASDKYQLKYLKAVCEQYLCSSLNVETVAKVIILADMHQATELKAKCLQYISQHASEVQNTEGWKILATKADRSLMVELFLNSALKN